MQAARVVLRFVSAQIPSVSVDILLPSMRNVTATSSNKIEYRKTQGLICHHTVTDLSKSAD
jgi:hypothetical protein